MLNLFFVILVFQGMETIKAVFQSVSVMVASLETLKRNLISFHLGGAWGAFLGFLLNLSYLISMLALTTEQWRPSVL